MKTLIKFWGISLVFNLYAEPIVKHTVGEDLLRSKVNEIFPEASKIEILNFFVKGRIPENATLIGLHPELPMGQIQAEYIWQEKGITKQALATAVAKIYSKVLVAHADFSNNDPFTSGNTRFEERELSPLRVSGYFTDLKELSEFRSRGFISHGTVIGQLQIAKPILVQSGQMIDLIYSKSNLRMSAKVKALERGIYNQWIRVENPNTKRILQGRVTEFGQASVN